MNMQRTASFALSCLVFVYLVYAIVDAWPSLDIPKPALHKEPKSHVGMDISHYQSDINWDEMVKNKLAFIFIKATQGMNYIDPEAKAHARAATAKAIPFGYYHFYSPIEDPAKQAQHFLKTTASQTASLRPVIDVEVLNNTTSEQLVSGLKRWIAMVEKALGCEVIVYTGDSFWHAHLATDFADKTLWLAEYRDTAPDDKWLIWQRSQDGRLVGLQGNVDLDEMRHQDKGLEALTCKQG